MTNASIEQDLNLCNDFGGEFTLVNNGISTSKKYLCFDKKTEILFNNKEDELTDIEAQVPSLTVQTSLSLEISNYSQIIHNEIEYGVITKQHKPDGTTIIFLESNKND